MLSKTNKTYSYDVPLHNSKYLVTQLHHNTELLFIINFNFIIL